MPSDSEVQSTYAQSDDDDKLRVIIENWRRLLYQYRELEFSFGKAKSRLDRLRFIRDVRASKYEAARESSQVLRSYKRALWIRILYFRKFRRDGTFDREITELDGLREKFLRSRKHFLAQSTRVLHQFRRTKFELDVEMDNLRLSISYGQLKGSKTREVAEIGGYIERTKATFDQRLDAIEGTDGYDPDAERVIRKGNGERKLTIERAMLLIYALGSSRVKGLDQKKMSHLIAYLIENEGGAKQVEKRFSKIFPSKRPEDEGKIKKAGTGAWERDIETVCYYLDLVGLPDESEKLRATSLNK